MAVWWILQWRGSSAMAASGSDLCSSAIAHLPQTQKDINDAVSEVWCQSESWRLRQFTHACCVVRPRGERHVLHWNDATMKTWILKMYQWSAHVMWHSELSFDPAFIKRWGAHRNRQVLLWLHVCVRVSFSSSLVIMWHAVLTWHYMKVLETSCVRRGSGIRDAIPLQGAHFLWPFHTSCALLSNSSVTHGLLSLSSLFLYNRFDRSWIKGALDIPV